MVDIPKCKEGHAQLPISIEPNAPRPGSYTVHFGGEGGAFNAAHIADLPQQINHINKLAKEEGFAGICEKNGDLYVDKDARVKRAPKSREVNLVQMFKEAEGQWKFFLATKNSIVPGKLESEGITLYKKGDYKGAKEIFDAALLKGEITTAAGMYYAGFNTLALVELDLFLVGKSSLDYGDPVDPLTFRKIVMLWGAATTLSLSERLILGDDYRFINMVRSAKFKALERLYGLDQIASLDWVERIHEGRSRRQPFWPKDPEQLHPGQLQKRIAEVKFDLKNHPNDTIHMEFLASFYALAGRFAEAIDLAKKAIAMEEKTKPPPDPANIILSVRLSRDTDDADRYDYRRILQSLVDIYRKAGHEYSKERIWALEKLRAHEKENFSLGEELAELYLAANDLEKAMDAAEYAERWAIGLAADALHGPKSAEGDKETATDYQEGMSRLARARNLLGDIHMALWERNWMDRNRADNLHNAVADYANALEIEPDNFDSLLGMAKAQAGLGNYAAAIEAIEQGVRLKGADHNLMHLAFKIALYHHGFQQADGNVKKAFHRLVDVLRTSSEGIRIAELKDSFRDAFEVNPQDVKAWQELGLALYDISAKHPDEPKYKKEALEVLTGTMDLLAKNLDVELKGVGTLSNNARVELLVALLTEAAERNQPDTALHYITEADFLEQMEMNDEIDYATAIEGISRYEREFKALDKLLYLWVADSRLEQLVNKLKWALLDELATKTDTNEPEGSNSAGSSGTPTDPSPTPVSENGPTSASGASEQSAAPELHTTVTLGSFDIDPPDKQSQTTSYTSNTAAAIRRRRNRARSNSHDPGNMVYGSGMSTFGARPAGQTNSTGVQVPVWLFRPVGK